MLNKVGKKIKWESSLPADRAYFGTIFFGCYFLPIVVITCCYYKIHEVSKKIVYKTSQMCGLAISVKQALQRKHRKSAVYFLTVIAAYLFSWTPYAVVSFLLILAAKINVINPAAISAASVFAKTSFCLNPILYTLLFLASSDDECLMQ